MPWRRAWQHIPVFLPGESHGAKSLVVYSPGRHTELDMTERLNRTELNMALWLTVALVTLNILTSFGELMVVV